MAKAIPVHPEDPEAVVATHTVEAVTPVSAKETVKLVPMPTPAGEQPNVASPFHREDY